MPALPIFSIPFFFGCDTKARVYPCELFVLTRHSTSEEAYFFVLGWNLCAQLGICTPLDDYNVALAGCTDGAAIRFRAALPQLPMDSSPFAGFLEAKMGCFEAAFAGGCAIS